MLLLGYLLITVALCTCEGHGKNIEKQEVEAGDFFGSTKSDVILTQEVPHLFSSPSSLNNVSDLSRPPRVSRSSSPDEIFEITYCLGSRPYLGGNLKLVASVNELSSHANYDGCGVITYIMSDPYAAITVDLSNMNIAMVEVGWYKVNIHYQIMVDLSKNNFGEITPKLLNNFPRKVIGVNLKGNHITQLKQGVIANQFPFELLNLAENGLSKIENGALEKLKLNGSFVLRNNLLKDTEFCNSLSSEIRDLDLSHNEITEISAGSFSKLKNLAHLNLTENHIVEAKASQLRGLRSLNILRLSHNALSRIEEGFFQDMKNLTHLHLESNNISSFDKDVFLGLEKIQKIFLTSNKLMIIPVHMFSNLPASLHYLELSGNKLWFIEAGSLRLSGLRKLYLQRNELMEINGNTFEGLERLEHLHLMHNHISTLRKEIIKPLKRLTGIDISFNPITTVEEGCLAACVARNNCIVVAKGISQEILSLLHLRRDHDLYSTV